MTLLSSAMLWVLATILFTSLTHAYEYGIDRLSEVEVSAKLQGKSIALLAHAASVDKSGNHLIDLLYPKLNVRKIFVPEHGLRSLNDGWIQNGVDEKTKLPIVSLYQQSGRAPKSEDLADIDVVVMDLQDVGVRYYTYFSTIAEFIKVATALNKEIVLLDRPNPIGGIKVEGETLSTALMGNFISYWNVPTRHGMTLGELARLFVSESNLGTKLSIIEVKDWNREALSVESDRPWIPSSPALMTLEQVQLYALWGSLEQFNLSVGRGQTNELAFRVIAAPWISKSSTEDLAMELNALTFEGVFFTPYSFKVSRDIYLDQMVNGVRIEFKSGFESIRTDEMVYRISSLLKMLYPAQLQFSKYAIHYYGSDEFLSGIKTGKVWDEVLIGIHSRIQNFQERRHSFLLYPSAAVSTDLRCW
jgi:uncharacterized protein YbbC (DUF1343 family)